MLKDYKVLSIRLVTKVFMYGETINMFQEFPDENKGDDFLNEFRQKVANQPIESFEVKREEMNRSKNVFIGAISGVCLAGIVGWFVLSPRYKDTAVEEIPVMRRPQAAIKVQPTDPGGMEIQNQDKTVYDIIEKKADDRKVVESVLPPPEEPKPIEVSMEEIDDVVKEAERIIESSKEIEEKLFEAVAPVAPIIEVAEKTVEKPIEEVKKIEESKVVETENRIVVKERPVIEIEEPDQKVFDLQKANEERVVSLRDVVLDQKKPKPVTSGSEFDDDIRTLGIASGSWQVQLMSSPNKSAVESSWNTMIKKHDVLAGQPYEIERADLGAKGVYYRLRAGAFKNKADADRLCKDVKVTGGSCIVNRKK